MMNFEEFQKHNVQESVKEANIPSDPWPEVLMEKLLDEYEKHKPLDETSWDEIQDVKWALWIGYNVAKKSNV